MKAIDRLAVIRHKSKINRDWKHKDLFRILRKNDIWIVAYENIKSNNKILTPKRLDGISTQRLIRLQDKVIAENYQFKPVKEIKIAKLNRRKKYLELPTMNDKIVQEVIRMILEAIYEPCFSKKNFGFRQGFETRDALEYIESKFRWVDWVIAGDGKSGGLIIDHKQLYNILSKKIQDARFMNLICKLLKSGILRQAQFTNFNFLVPQLNRIFSILANIYFNELDKWVENKIKLLNQFYKNQCNSKYKQLSYQIAKKTAQLQKLEKTSNGYKILLEDLKILKIKRARGSNFIPKQLQMEYIRYADSWIVGIKGKDTVAKELKAEVKHFMLANLKQTLQFARIKLTDLSSGKAKFLGYEIYFPSNQTTISHTGFRTRTIIRTNRKVRFAVPTYYILQKMEEIGYIKKLAKGYRSISMAKYTLLEDIKIVEHYEKVWKVLSNYYSECINFSKLQYIHYLLYISCAMTLSHRHRLSLKKIFVKYGKSLKVFNGNISSSFPYRKR